MNRCAAAAAKAGLSFASGLRAASGPSAYHKVQRGTV